MNSDRVTVLVVDDDADIREALQDVLAPVGYDVVTAGDGTQGLAMLRDLEPEVALVDVQMPGLSGTELLAQMAEVKHSTKIVLMTAYPNAAAESSALRLHAHAFLSKPFDLDVLLAAVSSAVRVHRLEAESERMLGEQKSREEALRVAVAAAEERAERLDALQALSVLASETLDVREVVNRSVRLIERLFSGIAEVRLVDEETGELAPSDSPLKDEGLEKATERAAAERAVVFDQDTDGSAVAAVPLQSRGALLGVLCLVSPSEPSPRAPALLPKLGATLSMALDNALKFRRSLEALDRISDAQQQQLDSQRRAVVGTMTAGVVDELSRLRTSLIARLDVLREGLGSLPADETASHWMSIVDGCTEEAEKVGRTARALASLGHND